MNDHKNLRAIVQRGIGATLLVVGTILAAGCGVRGRPQPPLTPPEFGHSQPTYKRGTEDLAVPNVPAVEATPEKKKRKDGDAN